MFAMISSLKHRVITATLMAAGGPDGESQATTPQEHPFRMFALQILEAPIGKRQILQSD
jgi:hypothetical protein